MKKIFKYIICFCLFLVGVFIFTPFALATWSSQTSGVNVNLNDVCFVDVNNGWAVGDDDSGTETILSTSDGGENWALQTASVTGNIDLSAVSMYDSSDGVAVGQTDGTRGTIFYTSNGGTTWTASTDADIQNKNLYGVCMITDDIGWVVGEAITTTGTNVLKTTDGGENWSLQVAGGYMSNAPDLYDVDAVSVSVATIVGGVGDGTQTLFHTVSGGTTWTQHVDADIPTTTDMNEVHMIDSETAYVVGDSNGTRGVLLNAASLPTDSWTISTDSNIPDVDLFSIHGVDEDTIWMVGETDLTNGVTLKTKNAGSTWTQQTDSVTNISLNGVSAINTANIWSVGDVSGGSGTVLKYSDTTAPTIVLNSITTPTSDSTPTFTGSGSDYDDESAIPSIEYRVDSGSWNSASITGGGGTSDVTYLFTISALTSGSHTVDVRGTDGEANTTSAENYATQTFTVSVSEDDDGDGDSTNTSSEDDELIATGLVQDSRFNFLDSLILSFVISVGSYLTLIRIEKNLSFLKVPFLKSKQKKRVYTIQF
ncbi:YCF48-related protein [Patescibacteria group bacterium]